MAIMGLRAYARHRDVSHTAVQKAIKEGRLALAVSRDAKGRPLIDSVKADVEWPVSAHQHAREAKKVRMRKASENSQEDDGGLAAGLAQVADRMRGQAAPIQPQPEPPPGAAGAETAEDATEGDDPGHNFSERKQDQSLTDFNNARARKEQIAAKRSELEYEKELGLVVESEEMKKRWIEVSATCRTKMLAVPTRIRTALPGLSSEDYKIVERIIEDAMKDLSDAAP